MDSRKLALTLHRAVGILVGLLLVISGLTGGSIVFQEEIDRALNASIMQVVPELKAESIDTILPLAQAAYPNLPLQYIRVPQAPNQAYQVSMTATNGHRLDVFVNPYTAQVIGSRDWERSLVGFLYTLHYTLFGGRIGQIIVGILGVLLLLLTITGLMLWTGWRKLANGFRIRWQAPPTARNYDMHNAGGIVSNVFLFIQAFTGIFLIGYLLLPTFTPVAAQVPSPPPKQPAIALSEILEKADEAMPDGKTTYLLFPAIPSQPLTIRKQLPQESLRLALSSVDVDRYSGQVSNVNRVDPNSSFHPVVVSSTLHFGLLGGLPTRILWVFVGFMPTVLFVTGFLMWRQRQWGKARRKENTNQVKRQQKNLGN
jgi:uncharacterized iron-regulated membrane protein